MTIDGPKSCITPGVIYTYRAEGVSKAEIRNNCCIAYEVEGGSIVGCGSHQFLNSPTTRVNAQGAAYTVDLNEGKFVTVDVIWNATSPVHSIAAYVDRYYFCGNISRKDPVTVNIPIVVPFDESGWRSPTCKSGSFNYKAPYMPGATYTWTMPNGWKIDGAPTATPNIKVSNEWNNSITGNANDWVEGGAINSGDAKVKIATSCATYTYTLASISNQQGPALSLNTSYNLCGGGDLVLQPAGGSTNYDYNWNIWTTYCPSMNCAKNIITEKQLYSATSVTVTATDKTTKCASKATTTVYPFNATGTNSSGWNATKIFTQNDTQIKIKGDDATYNNDASLLTDGKGNAYYTAENGQIYTYRYTNANPNYPWENYAVTSSAAPLSNGQMAYDIRNSVAKIYYIGQNGSAYVITSDYEGKNWSGATQVLSRTDLADVIVDELGTPLFVNGAGNILNTAGTTLNQNNDAVPLHVVATKGRVFFASKVTNKISCATYSGSPVSVTVADELSTVLSRSVLDYDNTGNVYYTATNGSIVKIRPYSTPNAVSMLNNSEAYGHGYLSVNKASQVIYFVGSDIKDVNRGLFQGDIYQLVNNTAADNFFTTRRLTSASYQNSVAFGARGAVAFRSPTVFYVSDSRNVRFINYSTSSSCQPATLREDGTVHDPEENLTKVADPSNNSELLVYPNPASEVVNVVVTGADEVLTALTLTDINGALVLEQNGESIAGSIELTSLAKGIYFVRAISLSKVYPVQKLIVK